MARRAAAARQPVRTTGCSGQHHRGQPSTTAPLTGSQSHPAPSSSSRDMSTADAAVYRYIDHTLLHCLQQDQADSAPPSALRPWHARTFVDSAVQRLSIALQRSIQRDQILRSHLRRGKGGNDAAPDGYYHGCGDGGYESGASSSSSSDGGGGGAGRFGGGGHSLIGGGSASAAPGRRAPRSAGEGTGP